MDKLDGLENATSCNPAASNERNAVFRRRQNAGNDTKKTHKVRAWPTL